MSPGWRGPGWRWTPILGCRCGRAAYITRRQLTRPGSSQAGAIALLLRLGGAGLGGRGSGWSGAGCLPVIHLGEEGVEDFAECSRLLGPWHVTAVLDHCGMAVREQVGYRD